MDFNKTIDSIARTWAGENSAHHLLDAWKNGEEAILAFPIVAPLYCTFGFSWYRLWVRPLVPDIEAIPEAEREYYERFMCTTPHNPNNVDLARDVLFQLTTPDKAFKDMQRIDKHVWPPLERAIEILSQITVADEAAAPVAADQLIRLRALHCWLKTQRNIAAWIGGVHGFTRARKPATRKRYRQLVKEAIAAEMDNCANLAELIRSEIPFMAVSEYGETPLMHGDGLIEHLHTRMHLMKKHIDDVPRIDENFMLRKAAMPVPGTV
jgi:hypothetical protein